MGIDTFTLTSAFGEGRHVDVVGGSKIVGPLPDEESAQSPVYLCSIELRAASSICCILNEGL